MRNQNSSSKNFASESGYILIATVGAIALVTLLALASYILAQATLGDAVVTADHNRAFQIAASAADYELTRFENFESLASGDYTLPSGEEYSLAYTEQNGAFRITTTATYGGVQESVVAGYRSLDTANAFVSGSGDMFSGSGLNTKDTIIIGPMYVNAEGTVHVQSQPYFYDGLLNIVSDNPKFSGGTFLMLDNNGNQTSDKYPIRTSGSIPNNLGGNPERVGDPFYISPPYISGTFKTNLRAQADLYFATNKNIAGTGVSDAVALATGGVLDLSAGTKADPYIIYVDGTATLGSAVQSYKGNFILYARDGIVCAGRLLPADYSATSSDSTVIEMKYNTILNGAERIPRIRTTHCASLVSPGDITLSWDEGNNSATRFSFSGVCYSEGTILFNASLRGSIIAHEALVPDKKTILATQPDLRDMVPEQMSALMKKVTYRDYWMRKAP